MDELSTGRLLPLHCRSELVFKASHVGSGLRIDAETAEFSRYTSVVAFRFLPPHILQKIGEAAIEGVKCTSSDQETMTDIDTCAIYILSYGDPHNALSCAESIGNCISASSVSIVHNPTSAFPEFGSTPSGIEFVVETGRNLGYAGGMNTALRHFLQTPARLVLLLTHDVRVSADAIEALVRFMKSRPEVGIAGPQLVEMDGSTYSCGGSYKDGLAEHLMAPTQSPDWIDGAALMIRRDCVEQIGLFDERLFMYWEDVDLSRRAAESGWTLGCANESVASQVHASTANRGKAYAYLMRRNEVAIELAHREGSRWRTLVLRTLCRRLRRPSTFSFATAWGEFDAFRGKMGPPPKRFQRGTDIEVYFGSPVEL